MHCYLCLLETSAVTHTLQFLKSMLLHPAYLHTLKSAVQHPGSKQAAVCHTPGKLSAAHV